jgi:hypothetical protein
LCSGKGKISEKIYFESLNLGMSDRFCPSLKDRAQLEEIINLNRERYIIPMHRKKFWTNKWMQESRIVFCRMWVHHYDFSAQYRRGSRSFKIKRGLTLCYNCRIPRHLAKEFLGTYPICICCKAIGHEVEDCPRMIAKVEKMNMRQENFEEGQETRNMLENQKGNESKTMLLQLKETMNDHRDISLP